MVKWRIILSVLYLSWASIATAIQPATDRKPLTIRDVHESALC